MTTSKDFVVKFIILVSIVFLSCSKKDDSTDIDIEIPPTGGGQIDEVDYPKQSLGYNWVITTNTETDEIEIYSPDFDDWNSAEAKKWSFKPLASKGWSPADLSLWDSPLLGRFREIDIWGGKCIIAVCPQMALISSYPDGEKKWSVHFDDTVSLQSMEILPNGNLALAANWVRIYPSSQGDDNSDFSQFALQDASALHWDDNNNLLWVTGKASDNEKYFITAFKVEGTGAEPTISEIESKRTNLPGNNSCNDISPMIGNPDQIWLACDDGLYIFNKKTLKFALTPTSVNQPGISSVSNQNDGSILLVKDDPQCTKCSTNIIEFYSTEGPLDTRIKSSARFSSAHSCNPNYECRKTYRIATYNIRSANMNEEQPDRYWSNRNHLVEDMILKYDFDIFGVQEAWEVQLNDLNKMKSYSGFGVSVNGDNTAAHNNIFYKKTRFKLLDSGTFWLSPDGPTVPTGPSWNAKLRRICTWGKFEDLYSGDQFYIFNTHFSHVSTEAREKSAALILQKVPLLAGDKPGIVMGDLNSDQNHKGFTILQESDLLKDSFFSSEEIYSRRSTGNGWNADVTGERWIDHILTTSHWNIRSYNVLIDTYGEDRQLPSDHFPVLVEMELK